ncbi:MAG: aldo/keto reductase [bacterium]|nr:aldo/keto reductase [bacterium]
MHDGSGSISAPSFATAVFGSAGIPVRRLGLSGTYRPGREAIHYALDHGVNLFFCYGFDGQTIRTLRDLSPSRRREIVLVTGAYNLLWGHPDLRRTLEKRLRQFRTDSLDVFLFLGVMKPRQCPDDVLEELVRFREEGKVRAVGVSTHDRAFAGTLAKQGDLNALMIRYNAAHRGAESDIFPHVTAHDPGVISYTATRWGYLLRRPRGWPSERPVPTARQCYRFVLSNPSVDVCLTAPANLRQLQDNLQALADGPLAPDEMTFLRDFGDIVHRRRSTFTPSEANPTRGATRR